MSSFAITDQALQPQQERQLLQSPQAGAYLAFEGIVRNHNDGQAVDYLEYHSHTSLALKEGQRILDEALQQFDIYQIRCTHRIGTLHIGDLAIYCGVIAAHRQAAFDACQHVVEEVKKRVPIWKKEFYSSGEIQWVDPTAPNSK